MKFTKTVGNKDPWGLPSDGTELKSSSLKKWERKQYHRARRREAKKIIYESLYDLGIMYANF